MSHDHLRPLGFGQRFVASVMLTPNYLWWPRQTRVEIPGIERIPRDESVIFVMNHTDRYNYWPFQWKLWKDYYPRQTVTWVKPKYFDKPFLGAFFRRTNNIRVPSRADVIRIELLRVLRRKPGREEYRLLRSWMDGEDDGGALRDDPSLAPLFAPRPGFDPAAETLAEQLNRLFRHEMAEVSRMSLDALYKHDLNLLVFPQGTRAKRLLPARLGITQIIGKSRKTVIPIGCNGSDRCYKGSIPLSRGGRIEYRVGEPLTADGALKDFLPGPDFEPFNPEHEVRYHAQLEGLGHLLTRSINDLLDPEYQLDPELSALVTPSHDETLSHHQETLATGEATQAEALRKETLAFGEETLSPGGGGPEGGHK